LIDWKLWNFVVTHESVIVSYLLIQTYLQIVLIFHQLFDSCLSFWSLRKKTLLFHSQLSSYIDFFLSILFRFDILWLFWPWHFSVLQRVLVLSFRLVRFFWLDSSVYHSLLVENSSRFFVSSENAFCRREFHAELLGHSTDRLAILSYSGNEFVSFFVWNYSVFLHFKYIICYDIQHISFGKTSVRFLTKV